MGRVPFRTSERTEKDPIVVCGGPVAYNIEPMADFFDAVFMGEGEEMNLEFTRAVKEYKDGGKKDRKEFLCRLSQIEGVYVPSLYKPVFEDGRFIGALGISGGTVEEDQLCLEEVKKALRDS